MEHSHRTHSEPYSHSQISDSPHSYKVSSHALINSTRPSHKTIQKGEAGVPSHKLRGATGISAEVHGKPLNVSGKMSGRKPRKSPLSFFCFLELCFILRKCLGLHVQRRHPKKPWESCCERARAGASLGWRPLASWATVRPSYGEVLAAVFKEF